MLYVAIRTLLRRILLICLTVCLLRKTKQRGDSSDNPAALKESTHMYLPIFSVPKGVATKFETTDIESYPLFSLDLYTVKKVEKHGELVSALRDAVAVLESHENQLPDLRAMHVLSAPDKLAVIVLGVWTGLYCYENLNDIPAYQESLAIAKKLSIEGTLSDILDKTKPNGRLFYVSDILLP